MMRKAASIFSASSILIALMVILAPLALAGSKSLPPDMKELKEHTFTDTRNMRFGEMIVAFPEGAEVFNTTGSNDLPAELWDAMKADKLKEEYGALSVVLNGPKYWMMDSQTLLFGGVATFGGIDARWAATLPTEGLDEEGGKPYQIFTPKKTQKMIYQAGKPVYELVDPDGHQYVLQARTEQVPLDSLSSLGDKFKSLPEGWSYRTRVVSEDLVLDLTPDKTIYAVGDEFYQYYTRIPAGM